MNDDSSGAASESVAQSPPTPVSASSQQTPVQPPPNELQASGSPRADECRADGPADLDPRLPPLGAFSPDGALPVAPNGPSGYAFYRVLNVLDPAPDGAPAGDVRVELTAPPRVALGATVPFSYAVTNLTPGLLYMLRPLDGSVEYLRAPQFGLYLRHEQTGVVYRWTSRAQRIDHPNAAQPDDVLSLEPQARYDDALGEWVPRDVVIPVAGTFTAWVVYQYCGAHNVFADFPPQLDLSRVARGDFRSAPVRIVVE